MTEILLPIAALGSLGLVFGGLLGVAARAFKVKKDERIELVAEHLPGANCGGCGFAGCSAFAEAIVQLGENPYLCTAIKEDEVDAIATITKVSAKPRDRKVAKVMCRGTCEITTKRFRYEGISDCLAAHKCGGGDKSCTYGCLGYGSCVSACAFNAISIQNGIAVVDESICHGCGACFAVCPRHLILLVPTEKRSVVLCRSRDKGAVVKNVCAEGCIGCKICEKNCPTKAITVKNNIALIDYSLCTDCGICSEKCPKHVISF